MIQYIVYGYGRDYTPFCQLFNDENRAYDFLDRQRAAGAKVHIDLVQPSRHEYSVPK